MVTDHGTSAANPLRVDWVDSHYLPLMKQAGGRLGMTLLPGKRSPGSGDTIGTSEKTLIACATNSVVRFWLFWVMMLSLPLLGSTGSRRR